MPKKTTKLPWMKFFPGDWSTDPALTLCAPATRGVWIDLICAMHERDQSGKLRGTADQLARFARCSTVEFVQAMTDLQTSKAADVTERNGVYEICNRRMAAAYKSRKSVADRVQRHRQRKRNGACNADETAHISEARGQNLPPPPKQGSTRSDGLPPEWAEVEEVLFGFGVAKAPEAVRSVRDAGCNATQVRNLIEFWRSNQPKWGVGALYDRLMVFRPVQNFDQLWPPAAGNGKTAIEVEADVFDEYFRTGKFTDKPIRHATDPRWWWAFLKDGTRVSCKNVPEKRKR